MDIRVVAQHLWPMWVLGLAVLLAVYNSSARDSIKFDKKAFGKFLLFLVAISAFRMLILPFGSANEMVKSTLQLIASIPLPLTLGVYWEDACHGLPLLLLSNVIGDNKWLKPLWYVALAAVMFAFGAGHLYQGVGASILLSLYIPFSIRAARKYGYGTVMACHIAYDMLTILTTRIVLSHL